MSSTMRYRFPRATESMLETDDISESSSEPFSESDMLCGLCDREYQCAFRVVLDDGVTVELRPGTRGSEHMRARSRGEKS